MKRFFTLLFAISFIFVCYPKSVKIGDLYYELSSKHEAKVVSESEEESFFSNNYDNISGCLEIPSTVNYNGIDYAVTSIDDFAFIYCQGLTEIKIPDSVKSIGHQAFYYCKGLNKVEIGNGVSFIGSMAFEDCDNISGVYISDLKAWCNIDFFNFESNPLFLAHRLYLNGEEVTEIDFPASLTSIRNNVFAGGNFSRIGIHSDVTSIGDYSFALCHYLTGVEIPNSVKTIGAYAFADCKKLEELKLPDSVVSLGPCAFQSCISLKNIELSANINSIGERTFYKCNNLTTVKIPDGVTTIGDHAFEECGELGDMYIPDFVTSIGRSAFAYCEKMTNVRIGNAVELMGDYAFLNCKGLSRVDISDIENWCGIKFENEYSNPLYYAEKLYNDNEEVSYLSIPESVTWIRSFAFYGCKSIETVEFPRSLTEINEKAFCNCDNIETIYCYWKPAYCSNNVFSEVNYNKATLYVPDSFVQMFYAQSPWNRFNKINTFVPADVDEVFDKGDEIFTVFSCAGLVVLEKATKKDLNSLPAGIYIVNGKKILLK